MNEFLEQFLAESRELVEQATADLLALERAPDDRGILDGVFRAFHTLKGGAGIVDFAAMARAMHAAEDVLSAVRAGDRSVTQGLIGDCLTSLDQVIQWLDAIQDGGDLPGGAGDEADRIVGLFADDRFLAAPVSAAEDLPAATVLRDLALQILREQVLLVEGVGADSAARVAGSIMRQLGHSDEATRIEAAGAAKRETGNAKLLADAINGAISRLSGPIASGAPPERAEQPAEATSRTLRVESSRVDALVRLAGEMTVAKNALGHLARLAQDSDSPLAQDLAGEHARTARLVDELQRATLALRVLPLRRVFQRFQRVVHEMSASLRKPARLVMAGQDTEADRVVVEMLFEPLLHIVRNALDHGIESPSERTAKGKPSAGTIALRARSEGEHVVVEVEDDGRGINPDDIRDAAARRGVATGEALAALSDDEALDLVFSPGFSTASAVTDLSGRGVGLDAARSMIGRVGGRLRMRSQPGVGTKFEFVLPFSVLMTRILAVEAGGQAFGIPLDRVVETQRVRREDIRPVGAGRAFVLRDRTVPLIELGELLGHTENREPDEATVVIAWGAGQLVAIEVDSLRERMDVMLSPPAGLLSRIPGILGTTLLGDGGVLLVLDLEYVVK